MGQYATQDDLDLRVNTATRLPVCIVLDTSASMDRITDDLTGVAPTRQEYADGKMWDIYEGDFNTYMKQAIKGVNKLYSVIRDNEMAAASCEIAIITFADRTTVLEDFQTVDAKQEFVDPGRGENTNLGAAVKEAVNLLNNRKQKYKEYGTEYYQPWLILITDGEPTDVAATAEAQKLCRDLEDSRKLTVFALTLGETVDKSKLQGFTKRKVLSIQDDKIEEFFEWLGKSASIVAEVSNDDQDTVQLYPGFDQWMVGL